MEKGLDLFFKAVFQFFADNPKSSITTIRMTNFDKPTEAAIGKKFMEIFR